MAKRLKKNEKKVVKKKSALKMKRMKKTNFFSVVWPEGKYYVARCLNVEVSSFGTTKAAALNNLHEALELYLEESPSVEISEIRNPSLEAQRV